MGMEDANRMDFRGRLLLKRFPESESGRSTRIKASIAGHRDEAHESA